MGEIEQPAGDSAGFHQLAGQHEEGDRHQGKGIGAGEQPLGGKSQRQVGTVLQGRHGCDPEGKGDRHPEHEADQQRHEQDDRHSFTSGVRILSRKAATAIRTELMNMKMPPTGTAM